MAGLLELGGEGERDYLTLGAAGLRVLAAPT
jgi:hypothetical protein